MNIYIKRDKIQVIYQIECSKSIDHVGPNILLALAGGNLIERNYLKEQITCQVFVMILHTLWR